MGSEFIVAKLILKWTWPTRTSRSAAATALAGHVLQGSDTRVCDDSAEKIDGDPAERADVGEGSRTDRR